MTPERYQQIARLFHSAQDLEPGQRRDYLIQASDGDEELLDEVVKLLAGDEEAQNFLSTPALAVAAEALAVEKATSLIGKRLGRFEILSMLGAGGMGEVYLAQDAQLDRRVALKLLPKDFTSHRDRLRRFEREARAASALNHPNIITIHDIGETEGIHFIATEYIEGEMLRRRIARGRLPLAEAVEIALQVANALDIAHSAGIIHRDIKPENIMRRPDGYVKVLDFGLAKLTEPKQAPKATSQMDTSPLPNETSAGMILGTVNYMSPEQARGLPVDRRCDLWSLGVTLYEMVVGRSPFTGQTMTDVIVSIVDRQPAPLTQVIPEVPVELERIVTKALAKDCNKRYQSARDMAIDLKALKRQLERQPAPARMPKAEVEPPKAEPAVQEPVAVADEKGAALKKSAFSPGQIVIALLLIVLVSLIAWQAFRPQSAEPVSPPAATSTPSATPPPAPERQISYWFTVAGSEAKTSEEQIFNRTDSFSLNLSSPQSGYLYLFNEEMQTGGKSIYTLLFPTQSSERISGDQVITTKPYQFSNTEKAGTETLLLVWSAESLAQLESLIRWYNRNDLGKIKDRAERETLKSFIAQHQQSTRQPDLDEASKQTSVQGSGNILVHTIRLKHK
jgi:serine/threonine protein kinase